MSTDLDSFRIYHDDGEIRYVDSGVDLSEFQVFDTELNSSLNYSGKQVLAWPLDFTTRICCFPVLVQAASHKAKITDLFAMEPPAPFHALVSKFVNFFVLSLLCQ
jgi:hypothetical protein